MAEENASGGGLSRKAMGLPLWAWPAIAGTAGIGWFLWRRHQSSAAAASTAASTAQQPLTNDEPSGIATDQYESILAQLRDLQEQEANEPHPGPPIQGGNPPSGLPVKVPPPPPVTPPPRPPGQPAPPPAPAPPPRPTPPPPSRRTVTVGTWPAWNSSLWGIAKQEYGSGTQDMKIFNANQPLIVGEELRHGMTQQQALQRKWLYPGEVLAIP